MYNIIPKPKNITKGRGSKALSASSTIFIEKSFTKIVPFLTSIFPFTQENISFEFDENKKYDFLLLEEKSFSEEEYAIFCQKEDLKVYASTFAGAFYALQTLMQLCEEERIEEKILIPSCEILDKPRFHHRGLHLDVARHFFDKNELMRLIELMSFYKLNVLHLHLTDDQGWRIEIKKFPLLTEIGSKRSATHIGSWGTTDFDETPYGGFYTQEQMKEIIRFAQRRNITIIPEIDIPAHCAAAIAAYNHLACKNIEAPVSSWFCDKAAEAKGFKDWNRPLCAGKKSTYDFIFGVLEEICDIFPSPFIHIGGDEAPTAQWEECPDCKRFMEENSIARVEDIQGFMANEIEAFVSQRGKRLIVWNDALKAKSLSSSIVGQYWTPQSDKNVIKHIKNGGSIILSKFENLYFDMSYSEVPLSNTFFFYPTFMMIPKKYEKNILGVEGALWTEWVWGREKLDFQLFPRMLALSEVCWRERGLKDYEEFLKRWDHHKKFLNKLNVNYACDEIANQKNKSIKNNFKQIWHEADTDCEFKENERLKKEK